MKPSTSTTWYSLEVLSVEWYKAGNQLGQPSGARCVVRGCYSMAFVALRTKAGNRMVCFQHYEQLEEAAVTGD